MTEGTFYEIEAQIYNVYVMNNTGGLFHDKINWL